jgi:hypothetical protein
MNYQKIFNTIRTKYNKYSRTGKFDKEEALKNPTYAAVRWGSERKKEILNPDVLVPWLMHCYKAGIDEKMAFYIMQLHESFEDPEVPMHDVIFDSEGQIRSFFKTDGKIYRKLLSQWYFKRYDLINGIKIFWKNPNFLNLLFNIPLMLILVTFFIPSPLNDLLKKISEPYLSIGSGVAIALLFFSATTEIHQYKWTKIFGDMLLRMFIYFGIICLAYIAYLTLFYLFADFAGIKAFFMPIPFYSIFIVLLFNKLIKTKLL